MAYLSISNEKSKLLYRRPLEAYFGGIIAVNKEVQRVMDIINDGTLLKRGPYKHFYDKERAQIGRYAADQGVSTYDILPPFFKNKLHGTEMVRGTCPMIVLFSIIATAKLLYNHCQILCGSGVSF